MFGKRVTPRRLDNRLFKLRDDFVYEWFTHTFRELFSYYLAGVQVIQLLATSAEMRLVGFDDLDVVAQHLFNSNPNVSSTVQMLEYKEETIATLLAERLDYFANRETMLPRMADKLPQGEWIVPATLFCTSTEMVIAQYLDDKADMMRRRRR